MARARQLVAAVVAIAALVVLALLSRVTWQHSVPDAAELRLSWRIPAPSYRHCRPPTEAELSGVLPHMRPAEVCTDIEIPFRLTVQLNGDTLHSEPIAKSGPRARTITVYRTFPVSPGSHALNVAFLPETQPGIELGVADAATRTTAPDSVDAPRDLAMTLSTRVVVGPREVILISPDANGRLSVAGSPTRPAAADDDPREKRGLHIPAVRHPTDDG
ncbi:MAG: hypothetical protein OXQ93_10605 [Gemmatimonadota bacterium]|nr:hypothetical protein [Gemmatimonadota bacterium]